MKVILFLLMTRIYEQFKGWITKVLAAVGFQDAHQDSPPQHRAVKPSIEAEAKNQKQIDYGTRVENKVLYLTNSNSHFSVSVNYPFRWLL